jgi:hypothetical protein
MVKGFIFEDIETERPAPSASGQSKTATASSLKSKRGMK